MSGKRWNGEGYNHNKELVYKLNNGKGVVKEYNDYGDLEYKGEYLNGQRDGKGKEYYFSGLLKIDGEYLKGYKNGKIKEYYENGKIRFEGDILMMK